MAIWKFSYARVRKDDCTKKHKYLVNLKAISLGNSNKHLSKKFTNILHTFMHCRLRCLQSAVNYARKFQITFVCTYVTSIKMTFRHFFNLSISLPISYKFSGMLKNYIHHTSLSPVKAQYIPNMIFTGKIEYENRFWFAGIFPQTFFFFVPIIWNFFCPHLMKKGVL